MCAICNSIEDGAFKNKRELELYIETWFEVIDPDHIPEIESRIIAHNWGVVDKKCSCGAKHTSFPNKHLPYCEGN